MTRTLNYGVCLLLVMGYGPVAYAADSYRWLTVSIETPWTIFLFLLPLVLIPLILMAVLYWHFAMQPEEQGKRGTRGARGAVRDHVRPEDR